MNPDLPYLTMNGAAAKLGISERRSPPSAHSRALSGGYRQQDIKAATTP